MQDRLSRLLHTKAEVASPQEEIGCSLFGNGRNFPLVIRPTYSGLVLREWVRQNPEFVSTKLQTHGAILFRGFHIDSVEKFQDFITVFGSAALEYKQRSSPRFEVAPNVYHSTTYPADLSINMHSENSYALNAPGKIAFCCMQPADQQGETPIADNRMVFNFLSPQLRETFLQKGVKYARNMDTGIGLSWREVFQTDNRAEVEEECRNNQIVFRWEGAERLELTWHRAAIVTHPLTKELVWFNHAFFFHKYAMDEETRLGFHSDSQFPFLTFFGDGSEISREEIEDIRTAYARSTVLFSWEKGDVLYMDNLLMSHGRSTYKGERKIIVSMF